MVANVLDWKCLGSPSMVDAACRYLVYSSAVQSSTFMCLMTLALIELGADMIAGLICEEVD